MARALREFPALPIKTTNPLHQRLMENSAFQEGGGLISTTWSAR